MKKMGLLVFFLILNFNGYTDVKDDFFKILFLPFNDTINTFVEDYSKVAGFYNSDAVVKGAASIGDFPSFRAGASFGIIFYYHPFNFLKKIKINEQSWDEIINQDNVKPLKPVLIGLDSTFIPLPVTNYHFEIGLFHGISVGGSFHVVPLGGFIKSTAANQLNFKYLNQIFLWGIGSHFNYTILKERGFLPALSTGTGFNYGDISVRFDEIPIGYTEIDNANPNIPTFLSFNSHFYNLSFYLDFTASKKIAFFQPFINLKYVQTLSYNFTDLTISLDTRKMHASARDLFGDGKFQFDNLKNNEQLGQKVGVLTPVPDFVIATGFELIISIFRMGVQGSFSAFSQRGKLSLSLRIQMENKHFDQLNKLIRSAPKPDPTPGQSKEKK